MNAVGIFGGSFDPIHNGHLITTQYVYEQRNLEKIIFIPSHISPLKQNIIPTSDEHRLEMVQLALEPFPYFESSDYEIVKGDISYTYDTLLELKRTYEKIELIIGFDNLRVFDQWRFPEKILEIAKLIVMKRTIDNNSQDQNIFFDSAIIINTPTIDISATNIRQRVKEGKSIDCLVPQKVKEYIAHNRLYL